MQGDDRGDITRLPRGLSRRGRCSPGLDDDSGPALELLALDQALNRLERLNANQARIVELRYFGALAIPETVAAMWLSVSTVNRGWRAANAWLYRNPGASA